MRRAGAIGGVAGAVLMAMALGLPAAAPAIAQDTDARALQERLQRLDRELNGLQQRVYRGAPPPAAAAAPSPAVEASNAAVGPLQARMGAAEDELRTTTGHIEEANAALADLRARLDRLGKDLDVRLGALEKAFAERPPAAAATPAVAPGGAKPGAPAAPTKQAAAVPPVKLPKGSAKEQYEFAFDLLKRSEYAQAEQALKQFVAAHPTDPLASNAQYWLGETLFVRSNFTDAAQQFLVGYQKYGATPKGPEYLYKLGLSLSKLNKKQEACAAYARFQKEYPSATGALRGRVADERQRLKCA